MYGPFLEIWVPAFGFEASYEVSNAGRVRSRDRVQTYERIDAYSGRKISVTRHLKGVVLQPAPGLSGHLSVVLGRQAGTQSVHVLVLSSFRGPPLEGQECRHLNGIPDVNWLDNLEWGSRSQNVIDALDHGAMPRGSAKKGAKLSEAKIPDIRRLMKTTSFAEIGRRFGVAEATIRQIKRGQTWRHA